MAAGTCHHGLAPDVPLPAGSLEDNLLRLSQFLEADHTPGSWPLGPQGHPLTRPLVMVWDNPGPPPVSAPSPDSRSTLLVLG